MAAKKKVKRKKKKVAAWSPPHLTNPVVTQIASSPTGIYSLCDDGSIWMWFQLTCEWKPLPHIPKEIV